MAFQSSSRRLRLSLRFESFSSRYGTLRLPWILAEELCMKYHPCHCPLSNLGAVSYLRPCVSPVLHTDASLVFSRTPRGTLRKAVTFRTLSPRRADKLSEAVTADFLFVIFIIKVIQKSESPVHRLLYARGTAEVSEVLRDKVPNPKHKKPESYSSGNARKR